MASKLPVEIVTHIMKFLTVADIKESSLVNRLWNEASLDPVLQRDVTVTLLAQSGSRAMSGLHRRRTTHLVLNEVDGSFLSNAVAAFNEIGDTLRSLSLKESDVTERTFVNIMSCCSSLNDLDLSMCNSLFMSGKLLDKEEDRRKLANVLKNVKSLNLSGIRYLSDVTFNRIVCVLENLEKISVASCQIVFNANTYYPTTRQNESAAVFTFRTVLNHLGKRKASTKSLNFSRTSFGDHALIEMSKVKDLKLEELFLVSCKEISDGGVAALCKTQTSLKVLDLGFCSEVTDSSVQMLTSHFQKMENLCLESCRQVTSRSVKTFHSLRNLNTLSLSACYQISNQGVLEGICSHTLSYLRILNLNACSGLSDKCVVSICRFQPQLENLDLGSCFHLTNISVQSISQNLILLRSLRLALCKEIDNYGILGLANSEETESSHDGPHHSNCRCTRQYGNGVPVFTKPLIHIEKVTKKLSLEEIDTMTNESDAPIYSLSNIKGLRSLDMKGCVKLTSNAIIHAVKFTELRHLDLSMCSDLTDECLFALAPNNPSIEELSIAKCFHVGDLGIVYIATHLHRLSFLNISCCDKVTDKGLQSLLKCQHMKTLDVTMCAGITAHCVDMLEQGLPYLHNVRKQYIGTSVQSKKS